MEPIELILTLIGVAFIVGSFFVQEKLSNKDVEKIAQLSEKELKIIVEKQVAAAKIRVEGDVEDIFDEALEITERGLEKTTNEKIMAVSEYSDTILETMNKTHNEIMFLYSMLNDKHAELTELAGSLQQFSKDVKKTKAELPVKSKDAVVDMEQEVKKAEAVNKKDAVAKPVKAGKRKGKTPPAAQEADATNMNKNEQILELHKQGLNDVEIAKKLGCGLGEVRLVLGLFKEEQ